MTALVVQAHPLEDSYNAALLDAVVARLSAAGTQHQVIRLGQGDTLTPAQLETTRELIAVYPTWWGSLPAVLLNAFNDIIGPWVDGGDTGPSPLRSIERITVITSHGSSRFINRLQGEPGLQLWKRTVLPLCAPGAAFVWSALYKLDRLGPVERTNFIAEVAQPRQLRSERAS